MTDGSFYPLEYVLPPVDTTLSIYKIQSNVQQLTQLSPFSDLDELHLEIIRAFFANKIPKIPHEGLFMYHQHHAMFTTKPGHVADLIE